MPKSLNTVLQLDQKPLYLKVPYHEWRIFSSNRSHPGKWIRMRGSSGHIGIRTPSSFSSNSASNWRVASQAWVRRLHPLRVSLGLRPTYRRHQVLWGGWPPRPHLALSTTFWAEHGFDFAIILHTFLCLSIQTHFLRTWNSTNFLQPCLLLTSSGSVWNKL